MDPLLPLLGRLIELIQGTLGTALSLQDRARSSGWRDTFRTTMPALLVNESFFGDAGASGRPAVGPVERIARAMDCDGDGAMDRTMRLLIRSMLTVATIGPFYWLVASFLS